MIGLEVISCDDADELIANLKAEGYDFGLCHLLKMNSNMLVSPGQLEASLPIDDLILENLGIYYIKI